MNGCATCHTIQPWTYSKLRFLAMTHNIHFLFQTDESEIFQAYQKCDNDSPVIIHDNSFTVSTETKCVNIAAFPFHVAGLLKSLAKPVRDASI